MIKKKPRPEENQEGPAEEQDVVSMIKRLQQQVTYLEKKIDQVLRELPNRSGGGGGGGGGNYRPYNQRPGGDSSFRPYGEKRDFRQDKPHFKKKGPFKPWMNKRDGGGGGGGGFRGKRKPGGDRPF